MVSGFAACIIPSGESLQSLRKSEFSASVSMAARSVESIVLVKRAAASVMAERTSLERDHSSGRGADDGACAASAAHGGKRELKQTSSNAQISQANKRCNQAASKSVKQTSAVIKQQAKSEANKCSNQATSKSVKLTCAVAGCANRTRASPNTNQGGKWSRDNSLVGSAVLAAKTSLKKRRTATPSPHECSKFTAALPLAETIS